MVNYVDPETCVKVNSRCEPSQTSGSKVFAVAEGERGLELEKDLEKDLEQQDEKGVVCGSSTPSSGDEVENPNVVRWDGDSDPMNPQNWSRGKKWGAIALGILLGLIVFGN